MQPATVTEIESLAATCDVPHELRPRFFAAALDSVVRGGASLALYALTPIVLARALEPHAYGVYATMMALAALVAGLFHLGQNAPLHKLLPQYAVSDRARGGALLANVVVLTLIVVAVCCLALFASAGWIATRLYHDATLTNALRACAALILALAFFNLASSVVAGLQDFQSYHTALLARSLALAAATWVGVVHGGLWGAFAGQFIALAVGFALLARSAIKQARARFTEMIRPDFSWVALRPLLAFVLPVFLMTLLNLPGHWWANTLLAQTHGFAEVGRFSAAYGLMQLIWLVPTSLYVPALTYLSEAHTAQRADFGALVGGNARTIWLLTLPLALGLALASPLLLRVLFGAAYQAATLTTFALSLTGLLMGLIGLFNTALTAAGRMWHGCAITLGWAVIFAVASWFCIPRWGAAGSALAYLISHIFYFAATALSARVLLQMSDSRMSHLLLLTLAAFAGAALLLLCCQGVAFYCAATLLLAAVLVVAWRWMCQPAARALFKFV